MRSRAGLAIAVLTPSLFFNVAAFGATATTTMAISATVTSLCTVNASPLAFGNYTSSAAVSGSTSVNVQCTNGTTYTLGLDAGIGSGATTTTRVMTGPSSATLSYGLFTNSGHTTNWGNASGSWVSGTGNGASQALTVYGQIPASQFPSPGTYNDTVTVTVTY